MAHFAHRISKPSAPEVTPAIDGGGMSFLSERARALQESGPPSLAGPSRGLPAIRRHLASPRPQAQLTVGALDDAFEREADRVADEVMRMPGPEGQRGAATPGTEQVQRLCTECEEEARGSVARAALPGGGAAGPQIGTALEGRVQALREGGRPLPESARAFFEPRFGQDFSAVRIHTGSEATEAAGAMNARAFTLGQAIAFGKGEFAPATGAGRRLLAHELTHTIQQRASAPRAPSAPTPAPRSTGTGKTQPNASRFQGFGDESERRPFETSLLLTKPGIIQRTATFQAGAKNRVWNLASRFADGEFAMGFTPPVLNGSEMDSADAAKAAIVAPTVETKAVGAGFEASVTVDPVNTGSFLMTLPTAGPWSTVTTKAKIKNEFGINECSGAGDTTFSINGDPDDASMLTNLEAHEDHHASDHEAVFNDVLVPWAEKITMAKDDGTKFAGNDGSAAEAALYAAMGGTPDEIATKLWDDWIAANDAFHAGAGSVQGYGTGQGANADCSTSFVKAAHG